MAVDGSLRALVSASLPAIKMFGLISKENTSKGPQNMRMCACVVALLSLFRKALEQKRLEDRFPVGC